MASGTDELDRILGNIIRERDEAFEESVVSAGERFREAIGAAADLFGIRISGPLSALLQPGGVEGEARHIADNFTASLKSMGVNLSPKSVDAITGALQGAAYGQAGGSVFASITGGKSNPLASSIGGALGDVVGKSLGPGISKAIGGELGKTLGGAAGPLGSIVGGILGNVVSGLFTTKKFATSSVTGTTDKATGVGNSSNAASAATSLGGAVQSGLKQVADMLGAQLGKFNVSIGTFDGKYRVSTTGFTGSLDSKKAKGQGLVDFGENGQEQAVAFAIQDALRDGALLGISRASQNILTAGKDLQQSINKALSIEAIPKSLKAMLDPVGAALDTLNAKWAKTIEALDEGGATADQYAQAERLYNLEREQAISTTVSAAQSLKDFLTGLKTGSSSPYSLRTQEANALGALKPFLDQIDAGKTVDQGKYQAAAQTYLDVSRQLYGSTKTYFDAFDSIQASTNKAIAMLENVSPITPAVPDPFTKKTAEAAAQTAAAAQTGNEIADTHTELLSRLVRAVEGLGGDMSGGGFIGSDRAFLAA